MTERAEHIDHIPRAAAGEPLCALALCGKDELEQTVVRLTNGNGTAEQTRLSAGNMNKLSGCCRRADARRFERERENRAGQLPIVPNGAQFLYGHK